VRDYISRLQAETGVNYLLGQMVFGSMSFEQAECSIRLFASDVMPHFKS
jgi:hypothetical protein